MTTAHHDVIPFGAPLTSAQMELPLGQLDAAIASVIATGSGASTSLTAQATAGQKNMVVASGTNFPNGAVFWIGDVGGTHETGVIASGGGTGTLVAVANLANTYPIGKPVSISPIELVDARGSYTNLGGRMTAIEGRVFDAKRYGAKFDGATSDNASVQAAVDAAFAAGGGEVWMGFGNAVFTGPVDVKTGVTVQGCGWGTTVTVSGNYAAFTAATATKVAVRDLRVVGSANGANTLNRAVQFTGVTHGLISGIRAEGCFRAIALVTPCAYVTVETCVVVSDTSTLGAIDLSGVEKCSVIDCTVVTPATHGIDVREATASSFGYNRVIGCHVQAPGNTGIVISGSAGAGVTLPGCEVIGNTVLTPGSTGIIVENGAQFTRVIGNMIRDSVGAGILCGQGTGDAPSGNVIEGNIIRNAGTHSIHVLDANYTTVSGNRCSVFGGDGIRISGGVVAGKHVVTGNQISDGSSTTGAAIRVYSAADATSVTGNVVNNTAGFGIRIEGSTGCAINGNTVTDADNTGVLTIGGISVDATSHRTMIVGNTSRRGSGTKQDHGVHITTGATNCMIVGNLLFQNTTSAILDNGTGTVSANNVTT